MKLYFNLCPNCHSKCAINARSCACGHVFSEHTIVNSENAPKSAHTIAKPNTPTEHKNWLTIAFALSFLSMLLAIFIYPLYVDQEMIREIPVQFDVGRLLNMDESQIIATLGAPNAHSDNDSTDGGSWVTYNAPDTSEITFHFIDKKLASLFCIGDRYITHHFIPKVRAKQTLKALNLNISRDPDIVTEVVHAWRNINVHGVSVEQITVQSGQVNVRVFSPNQRN